MKLWFVTLCLFALMLSACNVQQEAANTDDDALIQNGPTGGLESEGVPEEIIVPEVAQEAPVIVEPEDHPGVLGVETPMSQGAPNTLSSSMFPGELRITISENGVLSTLQLSADDAGNFFRDMNIGTFTKQETGTLNPFSATEQDFIRLTAISMGSNTLYIYKDNAEAVFNGFDYGSGTLHYYTIPEGAYSVTRALSDAYMDRNIYKRPADSPIALEN